ncbi:GMP synthase [Veronia pacifica]|uniref:GMP synthase n=2 Tax=Veronia pacifica TaxID=1080227 RepID=A0A1C3EF53_9GAMM|nr:GMP synthase [Veronia pacifica]
MRIGLLLCDDVAPELQPLHHNYPDMFRDILIRNDPDTELVTYRVMDGEYPSDIDDCDAYLISGSKYSVYDELDWIRTFEDFVRQLYTEKKTTVGVCFGHQMIAKALGGTVKKSERGWGVGVVTVDKQALLPDWIAVTEEADGNAYSLIVSHQDQVVKIPEEAQLLYGNDFCPIAMFEVGQTFLAVQGHPEFSPAYSEALMDKRKDSIPATVIEAGKQSLSLPIDSDVVTKWLLAFLKQSSQKVRGGS